jgi:hypothetical protein
MPPRRSIYRENRREPSPLSPEIRAHPENNVATGKADKDGWGRKNCQAESRYGIGKGYRKRVEDRNALVGSG